MTELLDATGAAGLEFRRVSHVKYLKSMLSIMPSPYISLDTSRLTALYFCVVGLDMLDELDSIDKGQVVEFIYSLQLSGEVHDGARSAGFIGGNFANHSLCGVCKGGSSSDDSSETSAGCGGCSLFSGTWHGEFHQGHIAMTYTALVSLITLGDNLHRVDKSAILTSKYY
jgi:geranylgeranyl transferase type-1 subunit beta